MKLDKSATKELKGFITIAKNRELPFGICFGKKPDDCFFIAHKTRAPEKIGKEVKTEGGTPQFTFGLMTVEGKDFIFSLEGKMLPGFAKKAKRAFKNAGLPAKIIVKDADGGVLEEDGDEEENVQDTGVSGDGETPEVQSPEPSSAAPAAEDPLKSELAERMATLVPQVKDLIAKKQAGSDKLANALKSIGQEISGGSYEKAAGLLERVEKAVDAMTASVPNVDELRESLKREYSSFADQMSELKDKAEKGVADKSAKLEKMFESLVDGEDMKKAASVLALAKDFVSKEFDKLTANAPSDGAPQADEDEGIFSRIKEAIVGKPKETEEAEEDEPSVFTSILGRIETAISEGIDDVNEFLKDKGDLIKMASAYPEAALAANAAIEAFDETLGSDLEITPEVLEKAATDVATANASVKAAKKALKDANAMKKGGRRNKAVKAALKTLAEAEAAQRKAVEYEKAAKGKKLLETEMVTGALAPDSNRKLSQSAALELVKGASRDPDLTTTAFDSVRDGQFPEDVAKNLGKMIDLKEGGFAANGKKSSPAASADYANKLLKMGGNVGPEYFERLDGYITSGRQFINDPTGEGASKTFGELEQHRTMAVGKALLDENGNLALESAAANNAIGDALFNPTVLRNARPALTSNMLETIEFLKKPENATEANRILQGAEEPDNDASKSIVRRATSKEETEDVGKNDVQDAVMATMLKSIDQGPVGSCFATAPSRRLRETDPLAAMSYYAQIACTGKFKPPFGPEVQAVTNTQPGDDPIMRSFEYSLATSTAQRANSNNKRVVNSANNAGMDTLGAAIKSKNLEDIAKLPADQQAEKIAEENAAATLRLAKLKADAAAAFTFVYDPLDEFKTSADGRSKFGHYILVRISPEKQIKTKQEFIDAMTEIALASLGIDKDDAEAEAIKDHVKSDTFIDAVTKVFGDDEKDAYLPWSLAGGGQTGEATQTLHGATLTQQQMAAEAGKPPPDEGDRTKEVLMGLLGGMSGKTDQMITVRTVGQHGFNALPNHSSLNDLKGDTPEGREQNIQDHLIEPGENIRDTKISEERVVKMFVDLIQPQIDKEKDEDIKRLLVAGLNAKKPTGELTPAELDTAVREALGPANDKRAEKEADEWKAKQSDPVSDDDLNKKKAELAKKKNDRAASKLATELVEFCAPPEFMIADSNWGSGADHTYFVIAPDPATGKPLLWTKTIPPGKLHKAGRDWVDHEWAMID